MNNFSDQKNNETAKKPLEKQRNYQTSPTDCPKVPTLFLKIF